MGVVLYWMPDKLGRKGTMIWALPIQGIAFFLMVFGDDIAKKSFGSFLAGFFHIKVSNSFTHLYELVPEKYRPISSAIINVVDDAVFIVFGICLKFFIKDLNVIFKWTFIIQSIAVVLYLLLIPESPKWLFYFEGPDSKRGIATLNYIAWINGSVYRVPKCAKLDLLGQAITDN